MIYQNGERTFIVAQDRKIRDDRNYVQVFDTKFPQKKEFFWLPEHIIDSMVYKFSWDRFEEDMDIPKTISALETEVNRIRTCGHASDNLLESANQLESYIEELKGKQ